MREASVPAGKKPLLRGVSHQVAFFVAIVATLALVSGARGGAAAGAALIFGLTLVTLFGVSALYHRVDWGPAGRQRMRRLDHAAIFTLIAGGYTPLFALVPSRTGGHGALATVWVGALLGVVQSLFWPNAPKWLTALFCVGLGWAVVGQVVDRAPLVGWPTLSGLVTSGVLYSVFLFAHVTLVIGLPER
jgi:hemolysin III